MLTSKRLIVVKSFNLICLSNLFLILFHQEELGMESIVVSSMTVVSSPDVSEVTLGNKDSVGIACTRSNPSFVLYFLYAAEITLME